MALDVSLEVPVEFSLNGERVKVEGVDPHTTLLDWVRSRGLTGSKEGCAEGECGACTVVWVRQGLEGAYYQAVNSCLLLLPMLEGQEVYTVEALAQEGGLAPVQQAMVRTGGSQCGYCTPGFVMSIFAEQYRRGEREFDIEALHGNLCRCTGYRPIQDAARSLAPVEAGDPFRQRLKLPPPALKEAHYRADGGYFYRPEKLKDAVAYLWQNPGAKVVAGGTDLAVEANLRYSRWERMVGLEALDELKIFQDTQSVLELGAGLSLSEIEAYVHAMLDAPQALQEWFKLFASPLIRNRATLGGNLATASPIGDSAPLLLALGAQARLASAKGERKIPLDQFFLGYRKTVLQAGELVVSILLPKPFPKRSRFYKIAKRKADDISSVAFAIALDLTADQKVQNIRLGLGGVAATPIRALEAEQVLRGETWGLDAVRKAQALLGETLKPIDDHRASARYRLEMTQKLLEKFYFETAGEVPA